MSFVDCCKYKEQKMPIDMINSLFSISSKNKNLHFRLQMQKDDDFLFELFSFAKEFELSISGMNNSQKTSFLKSQFTLKNNDYNTRFHNANFLIILRNKKAVGRLVFYITDRVHIVDISFSKKEISKGYGTSVLNDLILFAKSINLPLSLNVAMDNIIAMRLYIKLGFKLISQQGFHYYLVKE